MSKFSDKKYCCGVVGFGYWGPHLVRNLRALPRINEVVVCDLSVARLSVAEESYPGIRTYGDFQQMLSHPNLDAVIIATPSHTHYNLAKESLANGLHVLVEKPITTNSISALELKNIAEEAGLVLMVDHTYVYSDSIAYIKDLLEKNRMGEVRSINSVRINLGIFQPDVSVAWDLAIHDLAIICHLLQEIPVRVSATGSTHTSSKHPSTSYITLFFKSGVVSHIHVSWTSPLKVRRITVEAELGSIVFDDTIPDEKVKIYDARVDSSVSEDENLLLLNYRLGDVISPRLTGRETLRTELDHFIESIENLSLPLTSAASAVPLIRVLEAIDISISENGASVEVEEYK